MKMLENISKRENIWPEESPISEWFFDTETPRIEDLGKQYMITDYGILEGDEVQTQKLQALIDKIHEEGGGILVIPPGIYKTGALFFKQGVNLCVLKGGTLMGSDDISDYPVIETRIEGQTCLYFPALINADGVDGFTILGEGTIDGDGLRSWKAFWLRRQWNPVCTNKDEQRPRLIYISNSTNIMLSGVTLQNSHFWTTHIYKCNRVKYLNLRITSPVTPVKAPSTDAIDIDACTDILVKNCYMEVNDDSVVLKGGKGPWADKAPENGSNERILVEDCVYGFCHGCLTCGSESVHNKNVIVRRIKVNGAANLMWLKMRPDTPQHYEYILMEDVNAVCDSFININPWKQFFDLQGRKDIPLSFADHLTMKNINCKCRKYFDVYPDEKQYELSDFIFENCKIEAGEFGSTYDFVKNITVENVEVKITG